MEVEGTHEPVGARPASPCCAICGYPIKKAPPHIRNKWIHEHNFVCCIFPSYVDSSGKLARATLEEVDMSNDTNDPPFKVTVLVTDTNKGRMAKLEVGAENMMRLTEKVTHRMAALDDYDFFHKTGNTR
ncbi:hypothetical protein SEA_DAKITI_48 [Gordonia phage Dakiti]|uniref:Uncharacterized protein n=1 Tax=Gordonia phage Chelms TaxID=2588132 RepID=A0A4Y6ELK2_9CAUD|nr:hypothetical protein HWC24_gp082 [Gordonia phage Chelms]QDF18261.1 hypothetical protein SEA_CHELMS_47 [Gordonia phage Chelms]WIC40034.1 hypothetical protein SEA_DAKITI_48 [Gordonia phage Dakiti]